MKKVYDDQRIEIGHFDSKFVYDLTGKKIYWVEDKEVFSLPIHDDDLFGNHPVIKTGDLIDKIAFDFGGNVIFCLAD